ncbi:MAG: hypothetical protein A2X86_13090 [Bdellovibrionales bacterium GWA2_49_15]|nr:MAG: hypothetical protein A2X86_13090 [Bdellovibrionales bacterium GWA2_49_15]HAZ13458.1 hypothetical protein [Bdellovibrionales bacterium]
MDLGAVLLALTVSIGLKIPIMLITAALIYRMFRSTQTSPPKKLWAVIPKEHRQEFKWLYLSLICFFISETFCGVETWILMRSDATMRAIHALSSSTGMGLFAVGLYLLFNKKVIFYAEKKCVLNKMCKGCTLLAGETCKFNSTVLIFGTFIFLAIFPPFFVSTDLLTADPTKFILPFTGLNSWYDLTLVPYLKTLDPSYKTIGVAFFLPTSTQILENKILPGIVGVIVVTGMMLFSSKKLKLKLMGLNTILFGAGMLCYTYFEIILNRLVGDLFLGAIGHEIGEFVFLFLLTEFLTVTFRPNVATEAATPPLCAPHYPQSESNQSPS